MRSITRTQVASDHGKRSMRTLMRADQATPVAMMDLVATPGLKVVVN